MKKASALVSKEPLSTQAADLIRSAIMNGEHAMGERLVEADVAEKYQISRHVKGGAKLGHWGGVKVDHLGDRTRF